MKVSIIIPVFNGANYLDEAISSSLNQDYENFEVLVINDGSNDGGLTRNIALKYGEKIKYFEKKNGGVASALNFGINQMNGDFFSWLSHDDTYEMNKLSSQIDFIEKNQIDYKNNIIFSNYSFINSKSKKIGKSNLMPYNGTKFKIWLSCYSELNGCTLLIHKSIFDRIGYFDETLKHTQDYNLWFKMALKHNFIFISDHLICSRQHDMQDSRAYSSQAFLEVSKLKCFFLKNMPFSDLNKNKTELFKSLFSQKFYWAIFLLLYRLVLQRR